MARRTRGKRLAMAVLPAAATTAALTAGIGPAGANTITASHTFTDDSNVQHTCTVHLTRTLPFGGDPQVGEGGTAVTGDTACTTVNAFISATWDDPDGIGIATEENSDGASTIRRYAPIGSNFVTIHRVDFAQSTAGCLANCEFSASRK
jgi:hypothetical protein